MKKRGKKQKNKLLIFIVCLLAVYLTGAIGTIFTGPNTKGAWYESIKPSITPPNWVFPIVWNILFFLIAVSLFLVWTNAKENKEKRCIIICYGANLFLNALWSFLYFGIKSPSLAMIDLALLWLSILSMMGISYKIDRRAMYLLIPYLIWITFAGVLNYLSMTGIPYS